MSCFDLGCVRIAKECKDLRCGLIMKVKNLMQIHME
jgi:hypothetical protein